MWAVWILVHRKDIDVSLKEVWFSFGFFLFFKKTMHKTSSLALFCFRL